MITDFRHLHLARPLVVLDLEATGTDPTRDRIVEIAAVQFTANLAPSRFVILLNPGVPIPPQATRVHGLTDHDVARAPAFAVVAPHLFAFLGYGDLAGYNLKGFDLPLLVAELTRCGFELDLSDRAVLDPMQIFFRYEPRDLTAALNFYCDRTPLTVHDALADAYAAAAVLDAQLGRHAQLPRTTGELHRAFAPIDIQSRFAWGESGQVVFAFGKYAGQALEEIASQDPGYLRWMLGQAFLPDVKLLVRGALDLAGEGPAR